MSSQIYMQFNFFFQKFVKYMCEDLQIYIYDMLSVYLFECIIHFVKLLFILFKTYILN